MSDALEETVETAQKKQISLRIAAYLNAINRIKVYYDKLGLTV